ncbi:MAG TPA: ATP-dependent metallopeptidase FtsH/Yme1/Tma family protein, partial [Acidimicrobiia bacterium]|nr:ATP-dependent metallopeptidase FtsH/Yme1/Tma family protein [Acidimicrobiia bacterium]
MNRTIRTLVVYAIAIFALALVAQQVVTSGQGPEKVSLTDFLAHIETGSVAEVEILTRTNQVLGRLEDRDTAPGQFHIIAEYSDGYEGDLTTLLLEEQIPASINNQPDGFWAILIGLLPWVFLLGFMIFIFMQMQGSGNRVMQFGKARARMVTKESPKVTFNDVAGLV